MGVLARNVDVYVNKYEKTVKSIINKELGFVRAGTQYVSRSEAQKGCLPYTI